MSEIMFWEAVRRAHDEEMSRDPLVICMGEDIGVAGGTYRVEGQGDLAQTHHHVISGRRVDRLEAKAELGRPGDEVFRRGRQEFTPCQVGG